MSEDLNENKKRKYDNIENEEIETINYSKLKTYVENYIKNYIKNNYGNEKCNVIEFRKELVESNSLLSYSLFDIIYCDSRYNIISIWDDTLDDMLQKELQNKFRLGIKT
jgi:4-alpha-glucanotransferase